MINSYSEMQDRRHRDEAGEKLVAGYLDCFFYRDLGIVERYKDTAHQFSGLDLTLYSTLNGGIYNIDEKCASSYIGKELNSFAFSLSNINRAGQISTGWFLNRSLKNQYYVICWCPRGDIRTETIEEFEAIILDKDKLFQYLDKKGWHYNNLVLKDKLIRNTYDKYGDNYWKHENLGSLEDDELKFHMCTNFWEKDINLLIRKDVLIDLSDYYKHWTFEDELAKKKI